ncbi:MAG: thiamine phosphate synthase, partial [Methanocalculus sp. MSAO_Arc2]
ISAGADGAAVISAVVGKKDVTSAAADLRQLILTARNMKKPDI